MSQVKNLRAMFENNKGDSSPPDRGRSPTGAAPTPEARPLSKVRTNFVAVEKDGRMGLKRDQSGESSISRRRLSNDTDTTSLHRTNTRNTMASVDDNSVARTELPGEAMSQSPLAPGAVSDMPSTNPDKSIDQEQSSPALQPADTTAIPEKTSPAKETTSRAGTASAKPAPKASAAKPAATKTAAVPTKRPVTKPVGPARATGSATRPTQSSAAAAAAAAASKKPEPVKAGASETGFVKPKPKSPTKPLHLPSSLMAPTASSVSKGGASRLSTSRQSGNLPQSASAHSIGASASSNAAKHQSSVANRARPSLGVAPSKLAQQESSKRQSQVDDGFLARMMRPTQSSSSKTADKSETTPPKETAPRPSLSGTRHAAPTDSKRPAKSPVNKRSDSATHSRATPTPSAKPAGRASTATKAEKAAPETSRAAAAPEPSKHKMQPKAPQFVAPNHVIVDETTIAQSTSGAGLTEKLSGLSIDEKNVTPAPEEKPVAPDMPEEVDANSNKQDLTDEAAKQEAAAEEPASEAPAETEVEQNGPAEPEAGVESAEKEQAAEVEHEVEPAIEQEAQPEPMVKETGNQEPAMDVLDAEEPDVVEPEVSEQLDVAADAEAEPEALEEAALDAAQVETADKAVEIAHEADPVHDILESEEPVETNQEVSETTEAATEAEPLVSIDANHAGRKSAAIEEEPETDAGPSAKAATPAVPSKKSEATEEGN